MLNRWARVAIAIAFALAAAPGITLRAAGRAALDAMREQAQ